MNKKEMTEQEAYLRLATLCVQAEHCRQEMFEKMRRWAVDEAAQDSIIKRLVEEPSEENARESVRGGVAHRVRVGVAPRWLPRADGEARVVHVEVVVHVVVPLLAHRHERRVVAAAVLAGEESLHAERAQELALAPGEVVLHVSHEADQRGAVPRRHLLGVVRDALRERGIRSALRGKPLPPRGLHRRLLLRPHPHRDLAGRRPRRGLRRRQHPHRRTLCPGWRKGIRQGFQGKG